MDSYSFISNSAFSWAIGRVIDRRMECALMATHALMATLPVHKFMSTTAIYNIQSIHDDISIKLYWCELIGHIGCVRLLFPL